MVSNSVLIFHFKGKKEQYNFKYSSCSRLVLAGHLCKQMYLIINTYTLTSKKIKSNFSTGVVMSLKKVILLYLWLFNPVPLNKCTLPDAVLLLVE